MGCLIFLRKPSIPVHQCLEQFHHFIGGNGVGINSVFGNFNKAKIFQVVIKPCDITVFCS